MFCPVCKDEFRSGFTRCAACNVDLVDGPRAAGAPPAEDVSRAVARPAAGPLTMVEYCGFLALDEAQGSRERLRAEGIRSEIVIRDAASGDGDEYWLRVERDRYARVQALLGFDEAEHAESGETWCGECGTEVASEERFCPKCGSRFEDD